jgi:hypothetical protein
MNTLKFNQIEFNHIGEQPSMPLQEKSVTITKNGTTEVVPDSGYALEKVEVTTDVNTLQGLDFSEIYDAEQAQELNADYKSEIEYAEDIKRNWDENNTSCIFNNKNIRYFPHIDIGNCTAVSFKGCTKLFSMPKNMDFSNVVNFMQAWHECTELQYLPDVINLKSAKICNRIINNCPKLKKMPLFINSEGVEDFQFAFSNIKLDSITINTDSCKNLNGICYASKYKNIILSSIRNATYLNNSFYNCTELIELRFIEWKQTNISLVYSSKLSAESIDHNIENAIDKEDGATDRTLQLHATAGANWDANSKYQGEERNLILTQKGIEVTW